MSGKNKSKDNPFTITIGKGGIPANCPLGKRFHTDTYKDEDAYLQLFLVKTKLYRAYPFWGVLAMQLPLVEDETGFIPTFATDGRHIFYNAKFSKEILGTGNTGNDHRLFVIAHEIMHVLESHIGVKGGKNRFSVQADTRPDMDRWNRAGDYVINGGLIESKIGKFPVKSDGKTIGLYDKKYEGWTAEEVYDDLEEDGEGGEGFDIHIEITSGEGDGQGGAEPNGRGGVRIKMSKEEYERLSKQWKDALIRADAAQREAERNGSCSAGVYPSLVKRMIDSLVKPKINWKNTLRRCVTLVKQQQYSFMRPNRALFQQGITLPGFQSLHQQIDICIAFDTSGSVGIDQLTKAVSEMQGIINSFPVVNIKAWCFDGDVDESSFTEISKTSKGGLSVILPFIKRISGGGGTVFTSNWDFMKRRKLKPRLFLMMTDGYPGSAWGDPTYCPTMFMMFGNSEKVVPPFGVHAHYEEDGTS